MCLVSCAGVASAFSITNITLTLDPTNTANDIKTNGNDHHEIESSIALVGAVPSAVPDDIGASVGFDSRYAAILQADRESNGGSYSVGTTNAYSVTFTVDNPVGGQYRVDIDTSMMGQLNVISDSSGDATATIGAVTGSIDAQANALLGLSGPTSFTSGISDFTNFSMTGSTLSITSTGAELSRTFTLDFVWLMDIDSARDEAAIRLGIDGTMVDPSAGTDPNLSQSVLDTHGHFLSVDATLLTPEPGSFALLALGLVGVGVARRRALAPTARR